MRPLLDRLVGDVRGALMGMVLGLCTAVLALSGVIWHGHLAAEQQANADQDKRVDEANAAQDRRAAEVQVERDKIDAAQRQEAEKLWAALNETTARWTKETEAYRAQQANELTQQIEFRARALAIMERLRADVDAGKRR